MYGVTFPMSQEAMSDNFLLPIGKAKVEREGTDVTIVAHSKMVTHSLEAADELAKEGIKAEVINLRSIRPLDIETINKSIKKTNRYVLDFRDRMDIAQFPTIAWSLPRAASPGSAWAARSARRLLRLRASTTSMHPSSVSLVLTCPLP